DEQAIQLRERDDRRLLVARPPGSTTFIRGGAVLRRGLCAVFDARAHDVAGLGRFDGALDLRRRRGLWRIELGAQLLATLRGPVLLGERGDGADRDAEAGRDIALREPDALRLAVLIGHHLALDEQALDLVGVRELRAFALRGTATLRVLLLRHVPSEADGELD